METDIDTGSESNELEIGGPEKMDPYVETEDESGMELPMYEKATAKTDIDSESTILKICDPEMIDPNVESENKLIIPSYEVNNVSNIEVETVVGIHIDEKKNGDPEMMGQYMEHDSASTKGNEEEKNVNMKKRTKSYWKESKKNASTKEKISLVAQCWHY